MIFIFIFEIETSNHKLPKGRRKDDKGKEEHIYFRVDEIADYFLFKFNNFMHLDRTGWLYKYYTENISNIPVIIREALTLSFNSNYFLTICSTHITSPI